MTPIRKHLHVFIFLLGLCNSFLFAQPDTAAWHLFLQQKSSAIALADTTNFEDLTTFGHAIVDKKVVLLGEFTHGAKDINLLKARLIRYLHEKQGFNVLLFESGMGELASWPYQGSDLSPRQLLAGLIGPWRTQSWLDFMAYAKKQDTLQIGGFDVQKSGQSFGPFVREKLAQVDTAWANSVFTLEQENNQLIRNIARRPVDSTFFEKSTRLVAAYQSQIQLLAKYSEIEIALRHLIHQTFRNRMHYLQYMTQFRRDNDYRKRWVARDSMMAANILWFLEKYPNEKVIVSAHNFHVANYNEEEQVMGEFLRQALGDQMYSVGIFAAQGEYANNSRQPEALEKPTTALDIRSLILSQPSAAVFLGISDIPEKTFENAWLFDEIIVPGFVNLVGGEQLSLHKSFDGLLLLNRVTVPIYLH